MRLMTRTLKREKTSGGELWKPTHPVDIMLQAVFDKPYLAKIEAYGLPFYGIVSDFSKAGSVYGLRIWTRLYRSVRKYFLVGDQIAWKPVKWLASRNSRLGSIWCEFLLRGTSVYFSFCYLVISYSCY